MPALQLTAILISSGAALRRSNQQAGVPITTAERDKVFGTESFQQRQTSMEVVKHFHISVKEGGVRSNYPKKCQVILLGGR